MVDLKTSSRCHLCQALLKNYELSGEQKITTDSKMYFWKKLLQIVSDDSTVAEASTVGRLREVRGTKESAHYDQTSLQASKSWQNNYEDSSIIWRIIQFI